ncbi:MAG: hypothetical protein HYX69_02095 [Planctomycetia bacterium]|nr:hypothetical protein [Planctomycetia bacterium]
MWQTIVETLSRDPGILLGAILGSLGIVGGTLIAVTAIVSENWRKVRQVEDNNALKQSMLDRGMSADEIATVAAAGPKGPWVSFGRGRVRCQN